jgi:hypothetical protein
MEDLNAIVNRPNREQYERFVTSKIQAMKRWLNTNKNSSVRQAEEISLDYIQNNRGLFESFLLSVYKVDGDTSGESTSSATTASGDSQGSNVAPSNVDAVVAAHKLNQYLGFKKRLFGKERLCKRRLSLLSDLTADDIHCLESGYWQTLGTDVAGRIIVAVFPTLMTYRNRDSFLRAMFYFFMSLFPEAEQLTTNNGCQRNLVLLYYNTTISAPEQDPQIVTETFRLLQVLPVYVSACHIALHPGIQQSAAISLPLTIDDGIAAAPVSGESTDEPNTLQHDLQHKQRLQRLARYVIDLGGSRDDIEVKLRRYGITADIPCNRDGSKVNLKAHQQWMTKERQNASNDAVSTSVGKVPSGRRTSDASEHSAGTGSNRTASASASLSSHSSSAKVSRCHDFASPNHLPRMGIPISHRMLPQLLPGKTTGMEESHVSLNLFIQSMGARIAPSPTPSSGAGLKKREALMSFDDDKLPKKESPIDASSMAVPKTPSSGNASSRALAPEPTSKRQKVNTSILTETSIILPKDTDILFGRGSGIQNHPGVLILFACSVAPVGRDLCSYLLLVIVLTQLYFSQATLNFETFLKRTYKHIRLPMMLRNEVWSSG